MSNPMKQTTLVDLWIKYETKLAYLCFEEEGGESGKEIWLPKSQVELVKKDKETDIGTFEMPEWLAVEKELV